MSTSAFLAIDVINIFLMLNYNKSLRENNGKSSSRKSIYSGNKLHTTSMNLKVSNDVSNDYLQAPLKELMNNRKDFGKITFKDE